ncbi:glycosyltransferase [Labrenzia sp. 011]|uniref:glycosyltransferase n=1 Tax=Labrenzia sp. 011 TaxID=2171494 RepID=UPI000D51733C|nr:glycosyltransferase [Labrenzia sp. 011]PVB60673.1 glycosyl transferase family 1 [Labrenzia sp. 011]
MPSPRYLVMISDAEQTCGVEEFSRLLARRLGARAATHVLGFDPAGLLRGLKGSDALILNFPMVAWKKKLLEPTLAALAARISGKRAVVILHEWAALDWKRRVVLAPVVLLASELCFSAPEIAAEFAASRLARLASRRRTVLPIPPNLTAPDKLTPGAFSARLARERAGGRMILGQFGSIYPQKQVGSLLAVAADLRARGKDIFVAFAGSFIKGQDTVEKDFFAEVERLGLSDRVAVSGFIESDAELFAIFGEIDVFCYLLPDGLTSRRGSILAAAASGKPVVVNAPANPGALDHHRLFQRLIETGGLRLIPTGANAGAAAEAVLTAGQATSGATDLAGEIDALWRDAVAKIDACVRDRA